MDKKSQQLHFNRVERPHQLVISNVWCSEEKIHHQDSVCFLFQKTGEKLEVNGDNTRSTLIELVEHEPPVLPARPRVLNGSPPSPKRPISQRIPSLPRPTSPGRPLSSHSPPSPIPSLSPRPPLSFRPSASPRLHSPPGGVSSPATPEAPPFSLLATPSPLEPRNKSTPSRYESRLVVVCFRLQILSYFRFFICHRRTLCKKPLVQATGSNLCPKLNIGQTVQWVPANQLAFISNGSLRNRQKSCQNFVVGQPKCSACNLSCWKNSIVFLGTTCVAFIKIFEHGCSVWERLSDCSQSVPRKHQVVN